MNDPTIWTDELRERFKQFYLNPGPQNAACGVRLDFRSILFYMIFVKPLKFSIFKSLNNLAASITNLEKPFRLPIDDVEASIVDVCKAN